MVRIPRSEQSVGFNPTPQPGSSGAGYTAPGRALEGLGRSMGQLAGGIRDLGAGISAALETENPEDEFDNKLATLKFIQGQKIAAIDAANTYSGDGEDYAQGRFNSYEDAKKSFYPTLKGTEKQRQKAMLTVEGAIGGLYEHDYNYGARRKVEARVGRVSSALGELFSGGQYDDPGTVVDEVKKGLAGARQIINAVPGITPAQKERLYDQAASFAQERFESTFKGEKADGLYPTVQELVKGLHEEARAAGPNPGSYGPLNIQKAPGREVGKARTSSIRGVVVHYTEGSDTMDGNGSWSNRTNTGANYYVAKDGTVYEWAPDNVVMNHAGKGRGRSGDARPDLGNGNSLGIEIMTRPGEKPNPTQIAAAQQLIAAKAQEHGFTKDDVYGHGELAVGHRKSTEGMDIVSLVRTNGFGQPTKTAEVPSPTPAEPPANEGLRSRTITRYAGLEPNVSRETPSDGGEVTGPDRGENKIPATGSGNVETGNVSSDVSTRKPSQGGEGRVPVVGPESAFAEKLLKKMPSYAAAHAAAQERLVKGTIDEIKSWEDLANKGLRPDDASIARVDAFIGDRPELSKTHRLPEAVAAVKDVLAYNNTIRAFTPQQLETAVQAMEAQERKDGSNALVRKRIEHTRSLLTTMKTEVNRDALAWADKTGLLPTGLPPVSLSNPESLKERASVAWQVADYYNQAPQFFTSNERDALTDMMRRGGDTMLLGLGRITEAFGKDAPAAMSEFAKGAPEAAWVGRMVAHADGRILPAARDVAEALVQRQSKSYKRIITDQTSRRMAHEEALGAALKQGGAMFHELVRAAEAVYETRALRDGKTDQFDATLYQGILQELAGQEVVGDATYGGVGRTDRNILGLGGKHVLVPPSVKTDRFDSVINMITDQDLANAGLAPTKMINGKPTTVRSDEIRDNPLVAIGPNKYAVLMGTSAQGQDIYLSNADGKPYVLDFERLLPFLMVRKPDYFRGGRAQPSPF